MVHIHPVARRLAQQGKYRECGKAYKTLYNSDPKSAKGAQLLYNAGVCFFRGRGLGAALALFAKLQGQFPKSPLAAHALARTGQVYATVGWYGLAAKSLEAYAKRWPGAAGARDGLADAVTFSVGLGRRAQAVAAAELFVKTYARRVPAQAAAVMFKLTDVFKSDNALQKHLSRYLKRYSKRGGVDRRVIAHARLGELLWKRSCPAKLIHGLCISVVRQRSTRFAKRARGKKRRGLGLPKRCGAANHLRITVIARKRALVNQADRHFRRALALWAGGRAARNVDENRRVAAMRQWAAAAKVHSIDRRLERFLAVRVPGGLDFDPRNKKLARRSAKKWGRWFKNKKRLTTQLRGRYAGLATFNDPAWETAASSRVGQVFQSLADAVYTTVIPRTIRTGRYARDKVDAYCDALAAAAKPLEDLAVRAFTQCLATGVRRHVANRWTAHCARELGQIRPLKYPTANELRASATFSGDFFDKPARPIAYWEAQLRKNQMAVKPRLNIAWAYLRGLLWRPNHGARRRYERKARQRLSSVLAADETNVRAYALFSILYTIDAAPSDAQLTLARLFLDRGMHQPGNHADIWNLRGRVAVMSKQLSKAEGAFRRAVSLNANHTAATLNLGLIKLAMRDHAAARRYFKRVLKIDPKRYDAHVGLGVALRMRSNYAGAEKAYKAAMQIEPKRGTAFFNLGVLYKDFRSRQGALPAVLKAYEEARNWFKTALAKKLSAAEQREARANVTDCDRTIASLRKLLKFQRGLTTP